MSKLSKIGCSDFRWRAFILLVTAISIPVVAISFFLYASLAAVGHEITDLGRVYGKFLFKEQMTRHLLTMAKGLESLQEEGAQQGAGGEDASPNLKQIVQSALCAGLDQHLVVVDKKATKILYPTNMQGDGLQFLNTISKKDEFFRMILRAEPGMPVQGYFCEDSPDGSSGSSGMWYVTAIPAGKDLLLVSMLPEEDIRVTGTTLQAAQQELIQRQGPRFLAYALTVGLASAVLIGYIFCVVQTQKNDRREDSDEA